MSLWAGAKVICPVAEATLASGFTLLTLQFMEITGGNSRWSQMRDARNRVASAYQTQVAKRADISASVAKFVPVSVVADSQVQADESDSSTTVQSGQHLANTNAETSAKVSTEAAAVPHWLKALAGWFWRLIIVAAGIWLIAHVVSRLRMVFVALFIALVLSSVLRPVRNFYRRHMKRGAAVFCSMATAALVVGALLTYVIASVAHSWESLGTQFGTGVQKLIDLLRGAPLHLNIPYEHVSDAITAGHKWLGEHYGQIAHRAMASAATATEAIATIALSIFLCVFFLASGRQMWHWLLSQFPQRMQRRLSIAFGTGFVTFAGYARGQVIISLIDGIEAAILLTIMRVPLAVPLAVLVFIGSFIPMFGAPAAMLIAGVVALAAEGPVKALIVILGVALIGQIEAHLLSPFLMGHQVRLHPVIIALSVASGTMLAGIMGAVLAVPLVAVAWRVYSKLRADNGDLVPAVPQGPLLGSVPANVAAPTIN